MSDPTFDAFFKAVHDSSPYPWQSRLTKEVLASGEWPATIDLPTGTGKTAVLDTALFALAVCPDVFPRRIVFVIDRRIVVDQVYKRAELIRDKLTAATGGVLLELRESLEKLTDAAEPLGVAALRGGIPIDGQWAERPEQPWVLVSTVDQFGSRLLFRGYGVSEGMRPVHAGLAGNDCLVILDEVHLSLAFAQTLRDASSADTIPLLRSVNRERLPRRFSIVEMSATPANSQAERFDLAPGDIETSPLLKRIAEAPKRAKLVEVTGRGPAHVTVPKTVLNLIRDELREDEKSVGVIVNRVRTARETQLALRAKGIAAHLITGRMRPIDRKRVLDEIELCVDPDRNEPLPGQTVVVATQAIEVGADFSFDALITEAVPVDSLQQRLGRLDRRGTLAEARGGAARCWILGVESEMNSKKPDPVYGDAARVAWDKLRTLAEAGEVEVGPGSKLLGRVGTEALAPTLDPPILLPTHIDSWSQTRPRPVADPEITEFLHGKEGTREPDVSVVWRWDRSEQALELVPIRPVEYLSVPISAVRSWLRGTAEAPVADVSALVVADDAKASTREQKSESERMHSIVRWNKRETIPAERLKSVNEIRPGDVIVVDPTLGGLRFGTWDPGSRPLAENEDQNDPERMPVTDVGDQAQFAHRENPSGVVRGSRLTLRLDERLFKGLSIPPHPGPDEEQTVDATPKERVKAWLSSLSPESLPEWMATVVEHFNSGEPFDVELAEPDAGLPYWVLVGRSVDPAILGESDDAPSLTGTKATLRDHLVRVGVKVAAYARSLRLSEQIVDDLRLAAELHDLGKVDPRFQDQMRGHDPVRIAESTEPLAKSLPHVRTRRGDWPPVRHEISSVALIRSNPSVLERAHDQDLVLHLVGSHHGYSRGLPPIKEDTEPRPLEVVGRSSQEGFRLVSDGESEMLGSDVDLVSLSTWSDLAETPLALEMADRFWRLQERYGHHGLAWLEAILRLADHQQSAEENADENDD